MRSSALAAKMRLLAPSVDIALHCFARLVIKVVVLLGEHCLRDCQQFAIVIIGKIDVMGDARTKARIGRKELVHPVSISGQYDHKVVAVVFHDLKQYLDGFLAVVPLVVGSVEVIGFVNEEHAAHGTLENILRLWCSMADILAHQIITGDRHQMAFAYIAKAIKNVGHSRGYGCLACSGIAGKAHMQRRCFMGQTHGLSCPLDDEKGCDFPQPQFHGLQADQLAVEFSQHLGNT